MSEPVYRFDGWTLNSDRRTLRNPADIAVPLTPKEVDLLRIFLDNPQQRLSRQYLVDTVFGANPPNERDHEFPALTVLICRLRKKLQGHADAAPMIQLVRRGYWFCVKPQIVSEAAM